MVLRPALIGEDNVGVGRAVVRHRVGWPPRRC